MRKIKTSYFHSFFSALCTKNAVTSQQSQLFFMFTCIFNLSSKTARNCNLKWHCIFLTIATGYLHCSQHHDFFAGFDEVSSTGSNGLSGNFGDCCLCHLRAWSGDWVWGQGVPGKRNILRKPFSRSQLDCAGDISMCKSLDSFINLDQDLLKIVKKNWIRCGFE